MEAVLEGILFLSGDEGITLSRIKEILDIEDDKLNEVIESLESEYDKAKMAFTQAIQMEGDVPARYIALAKAEEKLGNNKKAIEELEIAYEIDPSLSTLRQMLAIYEASGDIDEINEIRKNTKMKLFLNVLGLIIMILDKS